MPQNIKINNVRSLDAKVLLDEYYDYMLYKGEAYGAWDGEACLAADFSEFQPDENGRIHSLKSWEKAKNEGVLLEDIGLTGIDNGFITYRKDRISNQEFLDILTGSTYEIDSSDTRFFMTPVSGNTLEYCYPMSAVTNEEGKVQYMAFNGGFYQGFYKLFGFDYQTLPNALGDGWTLHFKIRPRSDYETYDCTINAKHPENDGIFFYMGTRAENKFWEFYPNNSGAAEEFLISGAPSADCCCNDTSAACVNHVAELDYLNEENPGPLCCFNAYHPCRGGNCPDKPTEYAADEPGDGDNYLADGDFYFGGIEGNFEGDPTSEPQIYSECVERMKECCKCTEKDVKKRLGSYSVGWYLDSYNFYPEGYCNACVCHGTRPECCGKDCPPCPSGVSLCYCGPKAIELDYFAQDIRIDKNGEGITDSIGHLFNRTGYYEITTDNKFVFFNRTCTGFTTHNWTEDALVTFTGRTNWSNVNLFLLMNRTCTGWTTHTIQKYYEANEKPYDIYKDIKGNAFGLRITGSGAIGYKYGILDCSEEGGEHHYSVVEEYSKDGMVKYDQWNDVTVRIAVLNPIYRRQQYYYNQFGQLSALTFCEESGNKRIKIYVYVNGYLKLVSKELPEFNFRELDDVFQKQEGVPFSMSLGGGTQGLMETIGPDYMNVTKYLLPLERDFGGSFNGDIKSFRMYDCPLNYSTIRDYLSKNN